MKFRRRKYLIDKDFQMKTLFTFIIAALAGSLVAVAAFNLFALKELDTQMWSVHIAAKSTGEFLRPLFVKVNIISFLFISFLLSICVFWIIKRTSGPLYRISADINNAARGDLTTEIILRERDDFSDLSQELNAMLKNMGENINAIYGKYMTLSGRISLLKSGVQDAESYKSILVEIEKIEMDLKRFEPNKP